MAHTCSRGVGKATAKFLVNNFAERLKKAYDRARASKIAVSSWIGQSEMAPLQRAQEVQNILLLRWAERIEVVNNPISF